MGKRYKRLGFTAAQSSEAWERWQRGEGLTEIGRALGKTSSSIFNHLRPTGGIRPTERRRSSRSLTLAEREEISRGIAAGRTMGAIARSLGRATSTVSREIKRNGGERRYRAAAAEKQAWAKALRPKACKLAKYPALRQAVARKLKRNWSPEQIAGWLKDAYPDDETYHVSHETIYKSLFVQARGVLKKELIAHLRTKRPIRPSRHATMKGRKQGQIPDMVSIRERPAEVEDRAVPGHWEGDLITGSNESYVATLVERQTRYVMLAKVKNKETETVINGG